MPAVPGVPGTSAGSAIMPAIAAASPYVLLGSIGAQAAGTAIGALKDAALKKQLKKKQAVQAATQGGADPRELAGYMAQVNAQKAAAMAQLARGSAAAGGPTGAQAAQLGQIQRATTSAGNEAMSQAVAAKAQTDAQKSAQTLQDLAAIRARGDQRLSSLASLGGQAAALPGAVSGAMQVQDMSKMTAEQRAQLLRDRAAGIKPTLV